METWNAHRENTDDREAHKGEITIVILAEGLGIGVKANIFSTLIAKIIFTMMANSLTVEDCMGTIAATLPICKVCNIAYSTFTIIRITNNLEAGEAQGTRRNSERNR